MKVSNPYGMNLTVKTGSEIVTSGLGKASGKASARYPNTPLGPSQANGQSGKMKRPALTPDTTPTGS